MPRRKISACLGDFRAELNRLSRLDRDNQSRLAAGAGRPAAGSISLRQLHLLSEGVFFSAFRAYENFLEEVFLLYGMQKTTISGKRPASYLRPTNFDHARALIQSSMRTLEWASADDVIKRSEMYLKDGAPVKGALTPRVSYLRDMRHLRNHVAHNSTESYRSYLGVLRRNLRTLPITIPGAGEFLLMPDPKTKPKYFLQIYLEALGGVAQDITK